MRRGDAILDLRSMVTSGELFRSPADGHRIEAFIPPMGSQNHAANMVELPDGDLLCVWFAGLMEGHVDINIALSRLPAGQTRWSKPVWVAEDAARSLQNPVIFCAPDGRIWLLYTAQETRGGTRDEWHAREERGAFGMQWTAAVRCRTSEDNGHTWGPVQTSSAKRGSFCRQPMTVLSNGAWLFPMYYCPHDPEGAQGAAHANDHSVVRISQDRGVTWSEHPIPKSRGRVHASILELEPGRLIAFLRSRAADRIYVSRSSDYGHTWDVPEPTSLPNNNASIQALKLSSESIAIVFNSFSANDDPDRTVWPPERYPLTVAISEDEGETWPHRRHIDTGDDFCGEANVHLNRRCAYPCIIQTRDRMIHVAYSYRDRQCIKYVRFTEDWIRDRRDAVYSW